MLEERAEREQRAERDVWLATSLGIVTIGVVWALGAFALEVLSSSLLRERTESREQRAENVMVAPYEPWHE